MTRQTRYISPSDVVRMEVPHAPHVAGRRRRPQAAPRPEVGRIGGDIGRKPIPAPRPSSPSAPLPILLHGGGLDSTLSLLLLERTGIQFDILHVDYGQPTKQQELESIRSQLNSRRTIFLHLAKVPMPRRDGDVWQGRNAMLFSVAHTMADVIYSGIGCNQDDYPDASQAFLDAYNTMVRVHNPKAVAIAPTKGMNRYWMRQLVDSWAPGIKMWSCTLPRNDGSSCGGKCAHCRIDRKWKM